MEGGIWQEVVEARLLMAELVTILNEIGINILIDICMKIPQIIHLITWRPTGLKEKSIISLGAPSLVDASRSTVKCRGLYCGGYSDLGQPTPTMGYTPYDGQGFCHSALVNSA